MDTPRTATIVGAGIAGSAAAASLAHRGLKVRVFERTAEPREFGAGIYMKENSLPILERLGVYERIASSGVRILAGRIVDESGEIIVDRKLERERMIVVLRAELHGALLSAALQAGVDLITNATVVDATPDGKLRLADGTSHSADLVVAADGVNSNVRESLRLTKFRRTLGDGATRLVVPRHEEPLSTEYWAGRRRVGLAPCSADLTYMFIIGPERDRRAVRLPLDRDYWKQALPRIADAFDRVTDEMGVHHAHPLVICHRWTTGRLAIIGDAAHAQPPNLGQGAGVAIAAAYKLAEQVGQTGDVPAALRRWEATVRPGIDWVQRVTTAYDVAGYRWPPRFAPVRAQLFHGLSVFGPTAGQWEYWWRGGVHAPTDGLETDAVAA